ncbi:vesicle-associated membrane protein 3-like isoform X2 [Amblyraja radiata]|nr:vesicle-associated membrane protein 3-like isoform X2 [Amblyraja radiata]XP_032869796.1 vesicle-associated membrane protein 3-like isoform X2 [Amblyraja radiata]
MDKIHKDADEVLELMYMNVDKVKDRGEKLEVLDERAEELLAASKTFQKSSKAVARQERFKNRKWKLIVGATIALVLIIIIIIIIVFTVPSSKSSPPVAPSASPQQQLSTL